MPPLSRQQIKDFQREILDWYKEHRRDLPWRKTRNPYHILISEIMLQQTQVNRVIPKFDAWLNAFPTILNLAKAPTSDVLKLWSGLGYNRRALNLKRTAVVVSEVYHGEFPKTEKELLALPGIGAYTARAILCFAFDEQVAVVDTNVRKVILTKLMKLPSLTETEILQTAEQLLPHGKAYEWNQALMDYANLMLKKEKIAIPKQSKFHGSHRYYRGRVLKVLLEKKAVPVKEIGSLIKTDFTADDQEWLEKLLDELMKEGFIVHEKKSLRLQN